MARAIIALSGRIASGKSALGDGLVERFGVVRIRTSDIIREVLGARGERAPLQSGGDELDRQTNFEWVATATVREAQRLPANAVILVDAVRRKEQIDRLRRGFGQRVVHVHLTAPEAELGRRYRKRGLTRSEGRSFAAAARQRTERQVEQLAASADFVIDTSRGLPADTVVRVAARLGFFGRGTPRLVDVLVGGQYGSEGKGQVAAYLAPEYRVLVRVGGPNAGHQVYGEPKRTFHHLPSGTERNEDARIVLGPGSVLWLPELEKEIRQVGLTPDRLFIDGQAMMIDRVDRGREERTLRSKIGSTAQGVGWATARKVLRGAIGPRVRLARDEPRLSDYVRDTVGVIETALADEQRVLLEGTQGTALSLHHGDYPFVTSRVTTASGCLAEAGIPASRVRRTLMVCRSFPIRVESPRGSTSGPMSREIDFDELARQCDYTAEHLRNAERTSTTNRLRRIGHFDWPLFRRSVTLNGPTDIALTFADYIGHGNQNARRFEQLNDETTEFIAEVERAAAAPVSLIAVRFHYRAIIDRRMW